MRGSGASIRTATEAGLGGGVGLQLLYHVLLVIWQLSFEGSEIGKELEEYDHLLKSLSTLLIDALANKKLLHSILSFSDYLLKKKPRACFFQLLSIFYLLQVIGNRCSLLQQLSVFLLCLRISKADTLPIQICWMTLPP